LCETNQGRGTIRCREGLKRDRPVSRSAPHLDQLKNLLLDFDARLDFSVFQSGKWARDVYERFTTFMDRFHIAGWRRWRIVEPLSEAATLAPAA
jgi:penicillin-binding protein 1A